MNADTKLGISETTMESRVETIVSAMKTSDGAGVSLQRSLGTQQLQQVDPFLMLDEFRSDNPNDYIAGFPNHPHRGFETVTYMLAGKMEHKDHKGNHGIIEAGGVQWMTAGRGIIHSEMPLQENGLMWGFQLWVNLPSARKLTEAAYQELKASEIPEVKLENDIKIRVIAGVSHSVKGAVDGIVTEPLFLDIALPENTTLRHPIKSTHNSLIYVFQGSISIGQDDSDTDIVRRGQLAVLSKGDAVNIHSFDQASRFLLLSGKPIDEPVVKYGPFVMNSEEEIQQAIQDFRSGRLSE